MRKTLLEIAQAVNIRAKNTSRTNFTKQDLELVMAWLRGKVTTSQVAEATGRDPGTVSQYCGYRLRDALANSQISVRVK